MGLMSAVRDWITLLPPRESRSVGYVSETDYSWLYGLGATGRPVTTYGSNTEQIGPGYVGLVRGAYAGNPVVFACMAARQLLFQEARFAYRRLRNGTPGELFGNADLAILETPWPGGTTGDLLKEVITSADLSGNAFILRRGDRLSVLRPDWVELVYADIEAALPELLGIAYYPGGKTSGQKGEFYQPAEFAHFAPYPDPESPYGGMSWLAPVIREVTADSAATSHKLKFFENGATPNMVVSLNLADPAKFREWINVFEQGHKGYVNAYKTLYLGGGAEAKVVGTDLKQIDFKVTQGAGETRIAAAAGVPPIIVGLSEGLASATYSNYGQARRRFADGTMRPLWRNLAGSLQRIIPVPPGAQLWYDDRYIPFLAEDRKDAAEVQSLQAAAIRTLADGGYTPDSVVSAVTSGDLTLLIHTGLLPVQLQPPGESEPDEAEPEEPDEAEDEEEAPSPGRALADALATIRSLAERQATVVVPPAEPPTVNVDARTTFEQGAVAVDARTEVQPADIHLTTADSVELDASAVASAVADSVSERLSDALDRPVVREVERDEEGRPVRVTERRVPKAQEEGEA